MEYELKIGKDTYLVCTGEDQATVLDTGRDFDQVVTIANCNLWIKGQAIPEHLAMLALSAYRSGYRDGERAGYSKCQWDVKKVLGL